MRSKLPSGGMKEMVRSFSKRVSRTHWWNLMSSRSTDLFFVPRPWLSKSTCARQTSSFIHGPATQSSCGLNTGLVSTGLLHVSALAVELLPHKAKPSGSAHYSPGVTDRPDLPCESLQAKQHASCSRMAHTSTPDLRDSSNAPAGGLAPTPAGLTGVVWGGWPGARTLSLSPSLHSGMPERNVLILRAPMISDLTTEPLLLTSRFTLSTTSKKTSFFLYRMPSLRHDTAFVTAIGGRA